ncbi:MAG TPA: NUDIX domain-containing protein [Acidimicrobiia bacterium]|nr:NUDIX domain-containing protein [Acidimicrobiia bacterium]
MRISAGLLPYRLRSPKDIEVLIAHPGGPFFARKDAGAWSVVKGEIGPDEDARSAAIREFREETGWHPPTENWIDLGSVRLRSGKNVTAWAVAAEFDPEALDPGMFRIHWRGRVQEFPEIDRVCWCSPEEAHRLLNPAQTPFLDRLADQVALPS